VRGACVLALCCALAGCHAAAPAPKTAAQAAPAATIEVDGDPNGLYWDAGTLYIADAEHDRILAWTDASGVRIFAAFPATDGRGPGLGQLVRGPDGTMFVTRFGFGKSGDIAYAHPDGTTGVVPGLDPARRRIGLAIARDGSLYDTWFEKRDAGPVGEVARVSIEGHEDKVLDGFAKPVGALVMGDALYVSDQARGRVLRAALGASTAAPFATAPGVDLLCVGPDGSLFAGGNTGVVYRIASDGRVTVLASGLQKVRGVAYDAVGKRVFIAEHGADGPARHHILIVPVP
jgi:sugar lactone lactonase YvrE